MKNRNRSPYSFANINLFGRCNLDCSFCLGKDLAEEFGRYSTLSTSFLNWPKWSEFIAMCREHGIANIYVTGQNTDALLYEHLGSLIAYLQGFGFQCGLRTNGMLAMRRMDAINSCLGEVGYTMLSLSPEIHKKITGVGRIPEWGEICECTTAPIRVSIVVTDENETEVPRMILRCSNLGNVRYVQLRKVCTDTRGPAMQRHMDAFERVAETVAEFGDALPQYETAPRYSVLGIEVVLWRTVETTANSINYFTNGVLSDEYFIIEGYSKATSLTVPPLIRPA